MLKLPTWRRKCGGHRPSNPTFSSKEGGQTACFQDIQARYNELYGIAHSEVLNSSQARKEELTAEQNKELIGAAVKRAHELARLEYKDMWGQFCHELSLQQKEVEMNLR